MECEQLVTVEVQFSFSVLLVVVLGKQGSMPTRVIMGGDGVGDDDGGGGGAGWFGFRGVNYSLGTRV